jgi:DNA-binding LacI/PurR family transcriptional regulator
VSVTETTVESGFEAAIRAFAEVPAISAIVAINDAMAIGAIRAARAEGRRVPEDLAVVGFDNISWAELSDPPLTTVNVPTLEMGRLAARLLVDRLEGFFTGASRTVLSGDLVIRASCGCSEVG